MGKSIFIIILVALLLAAAAAAISYRQKSLELSHRLALIQEKIEQSKKEAPIEPKKIFYKAKIAIVIDDLGYSLNNIEAILDMGIPLTLSVLPNLPYSKRIARLSKKNGTQVILHLPLEPYEKKRLEKGTIMTTMTDEEILTGLERAMSSVPGLKGISNHMGSRATEDERAMSVIFKKMKDDDLYFLDSLVTNKSVCRNLAEEMGIRFASRSVFLDNETDALYIKGQIEELARQALATDWAIGIGHDRPLTIAVIKEMEPELKKMGIKVVPASELTK